MKLLAIHHAQITIPQGEEDRAREFYCGLLGLQEIPKPSELAGRGGFWLELGDLQIHIGAEDGFDRTKTKAHLAYSVEDLDNWRVKLEANNITVKEGVSLPGMQRFEFRDPFGNRVEFIQKI
jgi:catechol 2,3-dioxygenase-like lactoylglutathione lyase family enzyme